MLVTFDVSNLVTSNDDRLEQLRNMLDMLVTFDVSNLVKSNDDRLEQ